MPGARDHARPLLSARTSHADRPHRGRCELPGRRFPHDAPRFRGENLEHNLRLVDALCAFSDARGFTPGQIALAWLLAQPLDVVPIPGTKRITYLRENLAATAVPLSADDVAELAAIFDPSKVRGERYGSAAAT
jgi:aryl-alcohol dehydrogenase-like predicted oxidoreductase